MENKTFDADKCACVYTHVTLFFLILGGCMFGICKDAGKLEEDGTINMNCHGNENIAQVGIVLMYIGLTIFLIIICMFCTIIYARIKSGQCLTYNTCFK